MCVLLFNVSLRDMCTFHIIDIVIFNESTWSKSFRINSDKCIDDEIKIFDRKKSEIHRERQTIRFEIYRT